ncbi:MAG: hypothetical protein PF484_10585 [Bacteroidales bacterium]|nr:hypothetical protein [Bacteroidales bacterium]
MIHVSAINSITEGAAKGKPFSFKAITKAGELLAGENCICTSSNFERKTRNIKFLDSEEIRTIHDIQLIEFNGKEVFL